MYQNVFEWLKIIPLKKSFRFHVAIRPNNNFKKKNMHVSYFAHFLSVNSIIELNSLDLDKARKNVESGPRSRSTLYDPDTFFNT